MRVTGASPAPKDRNKTPSACSPPACSLTKDSRRRRRWASQDEIPYYDEASADARARASHLVIPYSLSTNDSKFAPGRAFGTSDDYFT